MKKILYTFAALCFIHAPTTLFAADGIIQIQSDFDVTTTVNRLERILLNKKMTVFNHIQHSESANKVGIPLRHTELIIFGNPKVGSKLIQCAQSMAIDLPQKALIWQDEAGKVWLSYNDMAYLAQRHGLQKCDALVSKVSHALSKLMHAATKQKPTSH